MFCESIVSIAAPTIGISLWILAGTLQASSVLIGPSTHIVALPTLPAFSTLTSYVSRSPMENGNLPLSSVRQPPAQTPAKSRAQNPGVDSELDECVKLRRSAGLVAEEATDIMLEDARGRCAGL